LYPRFEITIYEVLLLISDFANLKILRKLRGFLSRVGLMSLLVFFRIRFSALTWHFALKRFHSVQGWNGKMLMEPKK
jgi:hypothetical protein